MDNQIFLSTLVDMARNYGWSGDYYEVADFVKWCHAQMDQPEPTNEDLEPID